MSVPILLPAADGKAELLLYPLSAASQRDVVVEGGIYKFHVTGLTGPITLEPTELIEADPDDSTMGRFRPENHVGVINVVAGDASGEQVTFPVDVHPAKLEFESEYRSLLEQVADHAAEAVLQGFSPATRAVAATDTSSGELAYRSLAFIGARLRDDAFQAAIERILRKPHRRWYEKQESRAVSRGLPAGSALVRQLARPARPGPLVPRHLRHLPLVTLPTTIDHRRNEITFDTNPNRFIRFVFRHWQGLALDLERRLRSSKGVGAGPQRRGLAEARWIADECERVLTAPALQEVRDLRSFPHGDPVLLRQPGYREILRVFALAEASMALDATLDDDIFSATQRNIATLYEYWCFLVLVRCLTDICGKPVAGTLFRPSPTGLSLVLHEGSKSLMSWVHEQGGRRIAVDLWFNQTFRRAAADGVEIGSWASSIRPDSSLRIRPLSGRPTDAIDPFLDTWVHFDAKFRLDLKSSDVVDEDPVSTAKRTDLLKMHAYRDLIRRSAGAYVLYPGFGLPQQRQEFHEVLPGIGAFPLRPGVDGAVSGSDGLASFLSETIELTANQASTNERAQFWRREHTQQAGRPVRAVSFLRRPPADELVLVGFVRSSQLPWVIRNRRYNLRGDGRLGSVDATDSMLNARFLLLWTDDGDGASVVGLFERTGPWQIASAADLAADGYPTKPTARAYLVAAINPVTAVVESLVGAVSDLPLPSDRTPASVTWEVLARTSED